MSVYRYDPHVHTAETSSCGWMPASHVADLYHAHGFAGFAVTDHLHEAYIRSLECPNDWEKCMEHFLTGYRIAKARGDALGMHVLLGVEIRFPENDSDYLLYGLDEAFLMANPYLHRLGHEAFFSKYGDQLLIVHAHPYRNGNRVVFDACVHGVEVVNGNMRHRNDNALASALCARNGRLYRMCGSDTHRPGDEAHAWVDFSEPVSDSFAFKALVEKGAYRLGSDYDPALIAAANAHLEANARA